MAPAATASEPAVLASTKRRLFSDAGDADGYAVVDTQFASEEWLADRQVPAEVREALAPFNHVRVGSGYPDLVGVRDLDDELLAVDRLGADPPLVAVEAKGARADGRVDVAGGIVQAHDRLAEANVAFVAAPASAVGQGARTLASELNVGLLGVDPDGTVAAIERPRVVGNRTTTETSAIRLQASARGVADASFGLNHPKNYLAYPLAVAHPEPTDDVVADRVVGAVEGARAGAAFLGLIDDDRDPIGLRPLGEEVVRFARREHGSVEAALGEVETWAHSRERFCELAPRWGQLARRVVFDYPATTFLVAELQRLHDEGVARPALPDLVEYLHGAHPSLAVELFVRGDDRARERVLTPDGELRSEALRDGDVYHAPTVFQFKAMCYHAGILTERGAEPNRLEPDGDVWALRESGGPRRQSR